MNYSWLLVDVASGVAIIEKSLAIYDRWRKDHPKPPKYVTVTPAGPN